MPDVKQTAIYARKSDRAPESVEQQVKECRTLCERNGWPVDVIYRDDDSSLYHGKPREGYDAMMAAVKAGTVGRIVYQHPDRLHRSNAELEPFIETVEATGVKLHTVRTGDVDLTTPSGRMSARILASVARHEVEARSQRVKSKLNANQAAGKRHGQVPYGWKPGDGRDVEDPETAPVVRDVIDKLLAGHSIHDVVREMNAAGIPSPRGGEWKRGQVRHIVLRPRNVGEYVNSKGEHIGDGAWDAIVDRGKWDRVVALLRDPKRRTSTSSTTTHLLSGIATCGVCGSVVKAAMNGTTPSYKCAESGHVSRARDPVDRMALMVMHAAMMSPYVYSKMIEDRGDGGRARARADALRAKLDNAADMYADGLIDRAQLARITAQTKPEWEAAEQAAQAVSSADLLPDVPSGERAWSAFEAFPLARKRALIDKYVSVKINKVSTPGAQEFDRRSVDARLRMNAVRPLEEVMPMADETGRIKLSDWFGTESIKYDWARFGFE